MSPKAYYITIVIIWTLALLVSALFNAVKYLISYKQLRMLGCHSLCCFYLLFVVVTLVFAELSTRGKFLHNRVSQTQRLTATLLLVSTTSLVSWLPLVTANYIFYVQNITTPKRCLIYDIINILNYSKCFVNSVVYSLRILEFRQALVFCLTRRRTARNKEEPEAIDNRGFALTPLPSNSRYLQQDFELEPVDTKL